MTDFTKKCECGHVGNEHLWEQKSVTKLGFLGEGFFRIPQEGRGLCRKCSCPKYLPHGWRGPRRKIEYTPRAKTMMLTQKTDVVGAVAFYPIIKML